jgi:L-asparagine transporter-like permease
MNAFVVELLLRLFGETPWFFKVIRIIGIVVAIITGIPALLSNAGVELPESIDAIASQVVAIASIVATFVAQLTVTSSFKKKEHIND